MKAAGYQLSPRAAQAEQRYALSRVEQKAFGPVGYPGFDPGQQDGDNVRTNKITLERHSDGTAAVQGAATGLSATWACVSFWAGNIASLPLSVMKPGPGGVAVEDHSHPLHMILHDSPNYDQSAFDFWEFMVASIELRGNAYAEIVRRDDGAIVSLSPIVPDLISVRRLSDGGIGYRWTDSLGEHDERQPNMLHIRGFGGGPLGGVSPLSVCRHAFAAALAVERASSAVFSNGVRPSGLMQTDKLLTKEQRGDLEDRLQQKFVGATNTGRPMLLDNGLKWEQLSIDPHDAEMLDSRRFSFEEICRIFETDPHLVGQTQGNTSLGSSISEQTLSVLKFKMRKRLKRIEGAAGKQLLSRAERAAGVSVRFNVEAFLRADSPGRAEYYNKMRPFMTVNQVRALEGWPPVEGGDVIFKQMQDVPLLQFNEQPAGPVQ